jgi:hypothetical protein
MLERLHSENAELIDGITEEGKLSDEDEQKLEAAIADAIDDFGPDFDKEGNPLEEGESERIRDESEREAPARTESSSEGSDPESTDDSDDADASGGSDPTGEESTDDSDDADPSGGSDPTGEESTDDANDAGEAKT